MTGTPRFAGQFSCALLDLTKPAWEATSRVIAEGEQDGISMAGIACLPTCLSYE